MKNIIKMLSLVLICSFAFSVNNADAQTRKKKSDKVDEYFDDNGSLFQRLWYGADLNFRFIPFGGGNILSYGISPMAGLKVNEWLSVGPRIEFSNLNIKITGVDDRFNAVTAGAGLFARAKVGRTYFIHAEYDRISSVDLDDIGFNPSTGEISKDRTSNDHFFLGGGYTNEISDAFGIQFTILFDTLVDRDLWDQALPITSRVGITYKFNN